MSIKISKIINILPLIKSLGHAIYEFVVSEKAKKAKESNTVEDNTNSVN